VGNSKSSTNEIIGLIAQLKAEVPAGRFFEFGDNPEILEGFEKLLESLDTWLDNMGGYYASRELKEINLYSSAMTALHKIQNFIYDVRNKDAGSKKNTSHLRDLIAELDVSVTNLFAESKPGLLYSQNSHNLKQSPTLNPLSKTKSSVLNNGKVFGYEHSVFISYAWGDEREGIVNQIDLSLQKRGLKIVRDKRDLEYKGSIREFMERIGRGDCVIVVVSDKYLRSPNCMFELVEIAENKQFENRIFPVMWHDANIYDPIKQIAYIKYWEERRTTLAEAIKTLDPANLQGIREQMDLYDRIRDRVSGLTSTLRDMNVLTPEMHEESNFSQLYAALEKRIRTNID
jgi:hypothetical protein